MGKKKKREKEKDSFWFKRQPQLKNLPKKNLKQIKQ
jgi:hypothetical protein